MRLWIVLVLVLVSCGPDKDDVNCSWDEADRMNGKGEAPAGSCNICAPSCWVSLDRSDDREGIEADVCEE